MPASLHTYHDILSYNIPKCHNSEIKGSPWDFTRRPDGCAVAEHLFEDQVRSSKIVRGYFEVYDKNDCGSPCIRYCLMDRSRSKICRVYTDRTAASFGQLLPILFSILFIFISPI